MAAMALDLGGRPRPAALMRSSSSGSASVNKSKFWANLEPDHSLEDFPEFDPDAMINSPRSVQACESEGISLEELAYTPLHMFCIPGVADEVAQMRHDYHEARRQDLLAHARSRREVLITTGELRPTSKSGAPPEEFEPCSPGAPPSVSPCPNTFAFFKAKNEELSPFKEGTASSPGTPGSPSNKSHSAGFGQTGESFSPSQSSPSSPLHSNVSEPALLSLLAHMRSCPNADRVEHDNAKNTENNLVVLRQIRDKARTKARSEEIRLIAKRNEAQEVCFDKLNQGILENRQWREFREYMISPNSHKNERQEAREERVKAYHYHVGRDLVKRRVDYMKSHAKDTARRKERLANEGDLRKMAVAQHTMQQRIRWRYKHDDELRRKQQEFEDNERDLQEREERYLWRRANRVNNGGLRRELKNLRQTNRELNTEQRTRKFAWNKALEKQIHDAKFPLKKNHSLQQSNSAPELQSVPTSPTSPGGDSSLSKRRVSRAVPSHMPSPTVAKGKNYKPLYESWFRD